MVIVVLVAYFLALFVLALFGVHRLILTHRASTSTPATLSAIDSGRWPSILIQLPLYNEAFVAERVIRAAARLEYPSEHFEIQVLDDSTDDTRAVVDRVSSELRNTGVALSVVRRDDRSGYKAGALAHGLTLSDAELVAIFDSDFVPQPDFLRRVVPALAHDLKVGMVQARWGHLNRPRTWLTRVQGLYLDAHFGVEHRGRAAAGHSFNFNGTAGIWRREAIDLAGGWRDDTITEDLDLSYRAQLLGYDFRYLDDVVVPAELPESWRAFRVQQARWVKGSMQTARLRLGDVMRASHWSRSRRLEASVHLLSNASYLLMAAIAVLLPATVILRDRMGWMVPGGETILSILDLSMLTAGTLAMVVFYGFAVRWSGPARGRYRDIPFALCVGAGMSLTNAKEVLAGWVTRRSEFVRTPKAGAMAPRNLGRRYRSVTPTTIAVIELLFAAVHFSTVFYAMTMGLWGAIPFLLLYAVGFVAVGGGVVLEAMAMRVPRLPGLTSRRPVARPR